MKIAYFDCFSGASGDMILGALVAAGWPAGELEATLQCLGVPGARVVVSSVVRQGVPATHVKFELPPGPSERRLGELLDLLARSSLAELTKSTAERTLRRLGQAEANVHGLSGSLEEITLHELGSLDTLFDVVGTVAGLAALRVDVVQVSPIRLGGGLVHTAHGALPVPTPAVLELVRGLPVYAGEDSDGELLTPTGAVLLATLGTQFGPSPTMILDSIGTGAGGRQRRVPNVLRLWLGSMPDSDTGDEVALLETNIDDMNPEFYTPLMEHLFVAGALDVYLTAITMKKGRPGTTLSVLSSPETAATLSGIIFAETTTLGIRTSRLVRQKLERREQGVETPYGVVQMKVGLRAGQVLTAKPEFEDCRRIAEARQVPLRVVYEAAQRAFADMRGERCSLGWDE